MSIPFEMSGEDCSVEQDTRSERNGEVNILHLATTVICCFAKRRDHSLFVHSQ
jgi:hypothetical protein